MRNPYLTSNRIAGEVNFFRNVPVNSRTVCRRLRQQGLRNCKPALRNTDDDACLSLVITCSGENEIGGGFSSRMSLDFLPQDRQRMFTRRSNFFGGYGSTFL